MEVELPILVCKKCGHQWTARTDDVRICPNPKCHSLRWDKEKKEGKANDNE